MHESSIRTRRVISATLALIVVAWAATACDDEAASTGSAGRPTITSSTSPTSPSVTTPPRSTTASSAAPTTAHATTTPPTAPATAPSPEVATGIPAGSALQASVDDVVRLGVPGVAVLRRVGGVTEHGSAGVADLAAAAPITAETVFRTGSVAKPFVATVVLQLVAEGVISLDDTVDRWLPGLVPGGDAITVGQLLGNRSGLFDFIEDPRALAPYLAGTFDHEWTPEELVAMAVTHPPNFAPGTATLYSNTDYTVAGMIVERATSHPLAAEVEARIIRPLALDRTSMPADGNLVEPFAHGYAADAGMQDVTAIDPSLSSYGGNLVSTLDDLSVFLDALFTSRLLPATLLAEMETTTSSASGEQLGLGLQVLDLPCGRFAGHSGSTPGYKGAAFQAMDGSRQFVLLANSLTRTDAVGSPEAGAAFDALAVEAACGPSGR